VLVLLIDSDNGPNILLTERATALAKYPGVFVFPGGSAETGDEGSIATALREAAEETGIDPTHVHIIGSLPAVELPATRFLVTPVVGWCTRLELTENFNLDEVAAVVQIPLRQLAAKSDTPQRHLAFSSPGRRYSVEGTAVGDMTATVIGALLDHEP